MSIDIALAASVVLAVGHLVLRLLPLVSDRVNTRAVRLARAKSARRK